MYWYWILGVNSWPSFCNSFLPTWFQNYPVPHLPTMFVWQLSQSIFYCQTRTYVWPKRSWPTIPPVRSVHRRTLWCLCIFFLHKMQLNNEGCACLSAGPPVPLHLGLKINTKILSDEWILVRICPVYLSYIIWGWRRPCWFFFQKGITELMVRMCKFCAYVVNINTTMDGTSWVQSIVT